LLSELMEFEAPYLDDKLLRLKIIPSREQGFPLFQEVKKYLVLCEIHRSQEIPMFSRRVDEVWHQFVLFTAQYIDFSLRFFGKFVHHEPNEGAVHGTKPGSAPALPRMTFREFEIAYESLFGKVSDAWFDELSLTSKSRVVRAAFGKPLSLRVVEGKAEIVLLRNPPVVLCRIDARAIPALEFIFKDDPFYVRELPGLREGERLDLCKSLVQLKVLGVAP